MIYVKEGTSAYLVYTDTDQPPLGEVWKGSGCWVGRLNYTAGTTATGTTRKEVVDWLLREDGRRSAGRTRKDTINALIDKDNARGNQTAVKETNQ